MKLHNILLLIYFFIGDITNEWSSIFVLSGQNDRNYNCQSDDKDRLVVYTGKNDMFDLNEEWYFKRKIENISKKVPNFYIDFGNKAIMKVTNIHYIEIPVTNLYAIKSGPNEKPSGYATLEKTGIRFVYCPIKTIASHLYHFTNYDSKNYLRKYHNANRCSVGHCEIGLYIHKHDVEKERLKYGGNITYAFYIALKVESGEALLFRKIEFDDNIFPLVPCPYVGWIPKYTNTSFIPSDYVKDHFITLEEDFNRHRLIPAFEHKDYKKSKDSNVNSFICGHIKQVFAPDVPVGFELTKKKLSISSKEVKTKGKKILCGNNDISNQYLFRYLNSIYDIYNKKIEMEYSNNSIKFYSGQIIYAYDKNQVEMDRKKALKQKVDLQVDSLFDKEYFDDKIYQYHPICYGEIKSKSAVLKPKVGNVIQKEINEGNEKMTFKIANVGVNSDNTISCHAVVDGPPDERYSDFYAKRYKTKIQRIKDAKGNAVKEVKADSLPIIQDVDKFFGTYTCELEQKGSVDLILETEFIILPGDGVVQNKVVKGSADDKDLIKCDLQNFDKEELYDMRITTPDGKTETFNYNNKDTPDNNFKLRKDYVTYHSSSSLNDKNEITVLCLFGKPGAKNSLFQTKYQIDKTDGSKQSPTKKLAVIIGCVAAVVILIIVCITFFIMKKRKKKVKKQILSKIASVPLSVSSKSSVTIKNPKSSGITSKSTKSTSKSTLKPTSKSKMLKAK